MQFELHWVLKCFLTWNGLTIFTRSNTITLFVSSFLTLTLNAVNLLLWKKIFWQTLFKIITVNRPSTNIRVLVFSLCGDDDVSLRERLGLPASPKMWALPFCWKLPSLKNGFCEDYRPLSMVDHWPHIYWKESIPNSVL